MKHDKSLDTLIDSIIHAIEEGTVAEYYSSWLYKCKTTYGISSYTLQKMILFYQKLLTSGECPATTFIGNSSSFINIREEENQKEATDKEVSEIRLSKPAKNYWKPFLIILYILTVVGFIIFLNNKEDEIKGSQLQLNNALEQLQEFEIENSQISHKNIQIISKYDSLLNKINDFAFHTGAKNMDVNNYAYNWLMWFQAKFPTKIHSFKTKPDKKGKCNFILYDENGNKVDERTYEFTSTLDTIVPVSLNIPSPGIYSLGFSSNDKVNLCWHKSDIFEFKKYSQGPLIITGCSGENIIQKRNDPYYYLYFYDIKYSLAITSPFE